MTVAARQLEDATLPSNFVEVGSFKGRSTIALAHVMRRHHCRVAFSRLIHMTETWELPTLESKHWHQRSRLS